MAYIATKATYIGEEEILDENGKPIVDENDVPVKRIQTDVDDVVFTEGEVIVLIEKITEGKHFDLNIEDKGSTYFAPTQIKIGDGFHSFRELKWLQTLDYNRVHSALDKSVEEHTASLSKDYTHFKQEVSFKIDRQNQRIDNFIYIDARKILREIVNNNYFRITNGGLVGFTTNPEEYADKNCISIGNNTSIEKKSEGYTIGIGKNNTVLGDYSLIIGTDNKTKFNFSYVFGQKSYSGAYSIACGRDCNWSLQNASSEPYCTACFGNSCITKGSYSFSCGIGNDSYGDASFTCSRNNISYGDASFSCGSYNRTDANVKGAFACGNYNNGTNKLFSIGNGNKDNRSNVFDIDINGKSTFYENLNCNKKLRVNDSLYSNKYIGSNGFNFLIGKNSNEIPAMTIDESGNCYIHGDLTIYGDVTSDINYSHKMFRTVFNEKNETHQNGISIMSSTPGLYMITYGFRLPTNIKNYIVTTNYIMLPSGTYTLKYKTQFKYNILISLCAKDNNSSPIATIDNTSHFDEKGYTDITFQITSPTEVCIFIEPLKYTEDSNEPIIETSLFYLSLTNTSQTTSILDTVALLAYDIDQLKKQINNNES